MKKITVLAICLAISLSGCQTNKANIGTGLGAVGGGLLGSMVGGGKGKTLATIIGAGAGAYFGNSIGARLDAADEVTHNNALEESLTTGQSISWENEENKTGGEVIIDRQGTKSNGAVCKEFTQVIYIADKKEHAKGTACENKDGSWEII
jgi:surface antigen